MTQDNETDNIADDAKTASDEGEDTTDDDADVFVFSVLLKRTTCWLYQFWTSIKINMLLKKL